MSAIENFACLICAAYVCWSVYDAVQREAKIEVKDAIQKLFSHDRHPPAICHKCSSKMNQAEKSDYEKAAIAVFEPHQWQGDIVGDADGIDW